MTIAVATPTHPQAAMLQETEGTPFDSPAHEDARIILDMVRQYLPPGELDILDLGHGFPDTARAFALDPRVRRVVAIDAWPDCTGGAAPGAPPDMPPNLHFHRVRPGRSHDPADRFDLIYSSSAMAHISQDDLRAALTALRRALKPGGILVTRISALFYSAAGSRCFHLVPECWAHLMLDSATFERKLAEAAGGADSLASALRVYRTLNRLTAPGLVDLLGDCGFDILSDERVRESRPVPATLLASHREDVLRTSSITLVAQRPSADGRPARPVPAAARCTRPGWPPPGAPAGLHQDGRECAFDLQEKFLVPLVPLAPEDPRYEGIYTPEPELGADRLGITAQFLENSATYHERYAASAHWQSMYEQVFAQVGMPKRDDPDILDVGTGSGANSVIPLLALIPRARILGTDLSPQLLAMLRAHVIRNGLSDRVGAVCTDATRDFFRPESMDFATGGAILHHLIDPIQALKAVRRTLRPGGMAVFFEPFEGYSVIRAAFTLMLGRSEAGEAGIAPATATFLRAMARDHEVRAGRDKSDALYRELDDKWLFTRTYMTEAAQRSGFRTVTLIPLYRPTNQYRLGVANLLTLGGFDPAEALPRWAWDIVETFDTCFSDDLKGEATLESGVVFLT
jgi:SAM-dependent methyltransferase